MRHQKHLSSLVLTGVTALLFLSNANLSLAEISIAFSPDGSGNVNLGAAGPGKTISFYIGETAGANHQLGAAIPEFSIHSGVLDMPLGSIADGTASTSGFFANDNLAVAMGQVQSSLTRIDGTSFIVNQEFADGMQELVNTGVVDHELWFTVGLDTSGLDGTYAIDLVENPDGSFLDSAGSSVASIGNLSFTVTAAVPEPGSATLLAAFGVYFLSRRVRHKVF